MKYLLLIILFLGGIGGWAIQKSKAYKFLFFKPTNTAAVIDGKYPLMIFLHGAGERGNDLERVKKHGPPKLVEKNKDFEFYLISPQCPEKERWDPRRVRALIKKTVKKHPIDKSRIYLTGLSMGGFGTWSTSIEYPDLFAAIVPICGGQKEDAQHVDLISHIPVWAFHGEKDKIVPEENTATIIEALKKVNDQVTYTMYPGVYHDSWTQTYNNSELYSWLLSHRKK
ncbi:MAG: phospholipase [Saprospiraceae bacterium]|nr:phospholipase [Saprospiraceae bacterium]